ncbi:Nuclear transport factor 2 [Podochytrium sp. JEL0797]|nr:Nuclear transport factor 2 [Podochytrium sp. JEL0797]
MSAEQIAKGFTEYYYNAFDTNRASLAPLYVSSVLFHTATAGCTAPPQLVAKSLLFLPFRTTRLSTTRFPSNAFHDCKMKRDMSMLTYEDKQFQGAQNIVSHLVGLPFQRIKHVITKCDAQPSHPTNGSILIAVMGQLQFDDSPAPMNFVQTFHLYPEGGSNYFVYNDIFRLVLH